MIGKIINNYRIVSELGQGGMGIVYKAYDIKLDRFVAIKILKSQITNQVQFIERFKKEAKNQAKLSHQNIVPVYGFLEEKGLLGIIMEYVDGETLEHLIERKLRLDIFESIFIIKQVLKGAGYAHSKGFTHRDIKPSNVVINHDGISKIMDFGIAKSIMEKNITQQGRNIGTLIYMSPEQIKGEEVSVQSDIYSIGVTLFEMLTGFPPFDYNTEYEVIEGHLKQAPPELCSVSPELPLSIQKIVEKALNKKAQNRYTSAEEFLADLEKLEVDLDSYRSPGPILKDRTRGRYKARAALYSILIIVSFFAVVYFSYTQVLALWRSGTNPLILSFKENGDKQVLTKPGNTLTSFSWSVLNSGVNNDLNSVYFLNDSVGFCCGFHGVLLKTTNYGTNWRVIPLATEKNLFDICFNKEGTGYVVGEGGSLFRSTDLGENWTVQNVSTNETFFRIKFVDDNTGFIVGSKGVILRTTDKGLQWKKLNISSENILYDISFSENQTAFVVGWNGECFKTSDNGENWIMLNKFTTNYLKSIKFLNPAIGFIVGGNGDIFKTEDGGNKWKKINSSLTTGFYDVNFTDDKLGIITGAQGKLLISKDLGETWANTETNRFNSLSRINISPAKRIYAAGVNGTILKF